MIAPSVLLDDYFRSVEAVDVQGASDLVLQLFDEGTPVSTITTDVLAPAQVRVGQLWADGVWSVADEHAATMVTEGALSALTHAAGHRPQRRLRHLVVACVEGEWHTLAARMAAAVAATGDAKVTVLGPSLPAEQLHRRLSAGDIDALALSCTIATNLIGAARCVAAAHELGVPVTVGGRAFGANPHRAEAIGADAWSRSAAALLQPPPAVTGRCIELPVEALLLDAVGEEVIGLTYERVNAAFQGVAAMSTVQRERAQEDLTWMARYTGAAVLAKDPSIVE